MKRAALIVAVLLSATGARAEEWHFKFGKSAPGSVRASKVFGVGMVESVGYGFHYAMSADILSTPSNPKTVSLVAGPGLGVGVSGESLFVRSTWSAVYLSQTDQELGGHFQFMQDFVVGVQDKFATIGVGYKHISSAGLAKPNRGKDYFPYLVIGVKF